MDFTQYIEHILSSGWIYSIHKDKVNGITGYHIKFYDQTFIFGTVSKDGAEYGERYHASFVYEIKEDKSMSVDFSNYMDTIFSTRSYSAKMIELLYKKVSKMEKRRDSLGDDGRSVEDLEVEMISAAKIEDYERAAELKKIIDKKNE